METRPLIYLASVFTKYGKGPEAAFLDVSKIAARLMKQGKFIFSPIAHSWGPAIYGGIDMFDGELWNKINAPWLEVCSEMFIAKMDGWKRSEGIAHEIEVFKLARKPVWLLDPETLALERFARVSV